jgi:peptidoglycan-associated lipoprotein
VVQEEKVTPPAVFKAHPGLLGQPVPPELQPIEPPAVEVTSDDGEVFESPSAGNAPVERASVPVAAATAGQYSVYFDYRDTSIKPDYAAALQALGQQLAANRALSVQVEGNADDRGGVPYNQNLGLRRAVAVKKLLQAAGAKSKQVKTVSYGDTRPRRSGKDEASWAENRRVDVLLNEGELRSH